MSSIRVPARKPRSRSAKALAKFARDQIERARQELILIGGAYADVDQGVVNEVDEAVPFARLVASVTEAEQNGSNAE